MSMHLVVGFDGEGSGQRALSYAKSLSKLVGGAEILIVYVIEWSPFSFQTPEENATRHKRREEEIEMAMSRIVQPALDSLAAEGVTARGVVRHGDVAGTLNTVCVEVGADQLIVGRSSEGGFTQRIFGGSTITLAMSASVPFTIVA